MTSERARRPGPSVRTRVVEHADGTRLRARGPAGHRGAARDPGALPGPSTPRRAWVTMRTPGHDFELAAGWLVNEGLAAPRRSPRSPTAPTTTSTPSRSSTSSPSPWPGAAPLPHRHDAASPGSSACGVCGKDSIAEALATGTAPAVVGRAPRRRRRTPPAGGAARAPAALRPDRRRARGRAGRRRRHAARRARGRRAAQRRRQGGRGPACSPASPAAAACLVLSGRVGFELVQKAVASGIGVDRRRRRADQPRGRAGRRGRHRPVGLHVRRTDASTTPEPPRGGVVDPPLSVPRSSVRPVRILHTSDWHLGRSFHREDLLGHQGAFVDHLLEVVESEQVDLVVVSGDVYDRALPHVDAVAPRRRDLRPAGRLARPGRGHQRQPRQRPAPRLRLPADGRRRRPRPHRRRLGRHARPARGRARRRSRSTRIPYLDPARAARAVGAGRRSHEAALAEAMTRVRADLAARPQHPLGRARARLRRRARRRRESERDISVGGVSRVATSVFDGIDYAALGHLHGPHVLTDAVRYSGSPLAYSFSEADQRKGSWLVDLDADGLAARRVRRRPGPPPAARALAATLDDLLADPRSPTTRTTGSRSRSPTRRGPLRAMERLRAGSRTRSSSQFPAPAGRRAHAAAARAAAAATTTIALDFVAEVRGVAATPRSPRCSARPSTPAATTPTTTSSSAAPARRAVPDEAPPARGRGLRALRRPGRDRLRRALRRRAVPAQRRRPAPASPASSTPSASRSTATSPATARRPSGCAPTTPAADVAPRVVLEVTLSGRRFRIDRSPAWQRPKKRGAGTTTEQARVVHLRAPPSRRRQHLWHPLAPGSTRPATSSPGWSA